MKLYAVVLVLAASSSCAGRSVAPAPTITHFKFSEQLPGESRVCVNRTPFDAGLACMRLDELRQLLRGMRRASLH